MDESQKEIDRARLVFLPTGGVWDRGDISRQGRMWNRGDNPPPKEPPMMRYEPEFQFEGTEQEIRLWEGITKALQALPQEEALAALDRLAQARLSPEVNAKVYGEQEANSD